MITLRAQRPGLGLLFCVSMTAAGWAAPPVQLRQIDVPVRFVEYRFAVARDERGVPHFDWDLFRSRPEQIVTRHWAGIELENEYLKVTLIPSMGRIHSLVHKATGAEQLWINPCARPLPAHNVTGFWMTWGGMERVLPRGEHGTSHALDWENALVSDSAVEKSVLCSTIEPLTGLRHELRFVLRAEAAYLETQVTIENATETAADFSHWTTALWAPGGRGEVTPRTEIIMPAERFVPDDRPFNAWMLTREKAAATSPMRWIENWSSIGDLMTSPLHSPYYAVYAHETDQGVIHLFDLNATPTVDIWCWGFPPTDKHQADFTAATPNAGYVEIWNGNVVNFKDESLIRLVPGERIEWTERTLCISGLLGENAELRQSIQRLAVRNLPSP